MIKDFFVLGINNLKRRKLRSWLTMIGIFIGIAAVVSLMSLGQGLQDYLDEQFEVLGGDKILITPNVFAPPGSITAKSLLLTNKDLEFIKGIRGVKDAAGYVSKFGIVEYKDETFTGFIAGIDPEDVEFFQEDFNFFMTEEGREFKKGEKYKAFLGIRFYEGEVFDNKVVPGSTIIIEDKEFKVVGIMEKIGNKGDDESVFIPKDVFRELFNAPEEESVIMIKTAEGFDPADVAETIERKLRQFRGEKEDQETFNIQTSEQLLETFSNIFSVVQGVLVGIAAISLLVGGIGIMNTMYTSVLERTKEIGTMKAIGARNSHILTLFLLESGLLGLVGGIIGVGIGVGLAKAAEYIAAIYIGTPLLQASMDPIIMFGALAFSFIIGSLSGIAPAYQASKLKPVDALRFE